MRTKGELAAYQWLFEDPAKGWQPVNAPPPPPSIEVEGAVAVSDEVARVERGEGPGWPVILHDGRHMVSGVVAQVDTGGCLVSKTMPRSTMPVFRPGAHLTLNLLDPQSNRAENLKVTIEAVTKEGGEWEYRLLWSRLPRLLAGGTERSL